MKCSYFQSQRCRSCTLLDKSYESTLASKREHLASLFPEDQHKISAVISPQKVEGSRTKVKLAVAGTSAQLQFGIVDGEGGFTELEHCPLHDPELNALLLPLKSYLQQSRVEPYNLQTKKGEVKYVLLSSSADGLLVRLVLRSKESLDRLKKNLESLKAAFPRVKVVTSNIQPLHAAVLEGEEELLLTDEKVIWHTFDEFQLALGARSFFQVTPEIARKLYGILAEKIQQDRPASLLDLYCGVGAFSFYASRFCPSIKGVEISREAIECANLSCQKNNKPLRFEALDVEESLQKNPEPFEAVLVNPPRRGLNSSIISSLKHMRPRLIYYSSCNAVTMHRDFQELKDLYEIVDFTLFDMFPYTEHYETLLTLKLT